jgi:hypothetical protein
MHTGTHEPRYDTAIRALYRHHDLSEIDRGLLPLVRYATLAASSHNTQPWLFELSEARVSILPDLSRRCPTVDPDNHHLYASLGCAAENLKQAARAAGFETRLRQDDASGALHVELEKAMPYRTRLFEAIPRRQCSRTEYDGVALSPEQLRLLENVGFGDGVSLLLLTEPRQKAQIAEYVAEGNRAQFADARWADEMKRWIRFNAAEALRTGDGLYGAALGIPSVPRWLGAPLMGVAATASGQNEKDRAHILSSSAIAILFSEADDRRHWVEAGRCYERLALQATALDLQTAFINQPVEVEALRPQLATFLGIGGRRPDLLVRIGHGPAGPRTLRRPLDEVVIPGR